MGMIVDQAGSQSHLPAIEKQKAPRRQSFGELSTFFLDG